MSNFFSTVPVQTSWFYLSLTLYAILIALVLIAVAGWARSIWLYWVPFSLLVVSLGVKVVHELTSSSELAGGWYELSHDQLNQIVVTFMLTSLVFRRIRSQHR